MSGGRGHIAPMDDRRYQLLVNAITDYAIYMLDPAGIVTSWNAGAERIKGYLADEIIGEHFSRFYTEEDRAAGAPERALAVAAEVGRFESEGWRLRKDGARFWAHVIIDPIRGDDGALLGFAKITRELSERKEAEAALRLSEERFRLLVQSVTDYAIFMLDRDGLVANWNPGAERIKGYTPDEIIGEHFSRFYTEGRPGSRPAGNRPFHRHRRGALGERGPALAQGRLGVLGACGDRPDPRLERRGDRLRQDHPRRHRAEGVAAPAGGGARGAVPGPEDGGARPADRRHRPRLQQPA